MDLIPRVTCRRCGAEYSAMQSRCPKCGTRKMKQTQRTPGNTAGTVSGTYANEQAQVNAKWQMTFAAILVVAVILAMIVLITTSLNTERSDAGTTPTPPVSQDVSPTPSSTPTPTPTPTPAITSVTIKYGNEVKTEFAVRNGETVQLEAEIYPLAPDGTPWPVTWECNKEEVCTVDENGLVTGMGGEGAATITVTCYGKSATCTVYTRQS